MTTTDFQVSFVGSSIHEGADGEDSVTSWKATLTRYRRDDTPAPIPTGVSGWWPTKEEAAAELIKELAARLERNEKARLAAVRTAEGYQEDANAAQVELSACERNLKAAAELAGRFQGLTIDANELIAELRAKIDKLKAKRKRKKAKAES